MSSEWHDRSGYEVANLEAFNWTVLVKGGGYYDQEPSWRPVAVCNERDEAFRVRDALRAMLPKAGSDTLTGRDPERDEP